MVFAGRAGAAPFRNLDFEEGRPDSGRLYQDPAVAFPGWTVHPRSHVTFYNLLSLGGGAQILLDNNWSGASNFPVIQGTYSALLMFNSPLSDGAGGLSQRATIPDDARSMTFAVLPDRFRDALVLVNGAGVPVFELPGRLAIDVTAHAGQETEIGFMTNGGSLLFDDIQFSSNTVPEPGSVAMIGLGMIGMIGYGIRRRAQKKLTLVCASARTMRTEPVLFSL